MITKAYVIEEYQNEFLEKIAKESDRSISYVVRQIFQGRIDDNSVVVIEKKPKEEDESKATQG